MRFGRLSKRWLAALWVACAALVLVRLALGVRHGLAAEYFDDLALDAVPMFRQVDQGFTRQDVVNAWLFNPPPAFRVRWSGFLAVGDAGTYVFSLRSDDGSVLLVDGRPTIDNGGSHEPRTVTAKLDLTPGPHSIQIDFTNDVGLFDFDWRWSRDGVEWMAVPSWQLSTQRSSYEAVVAARLLDWLIALGILTTAVLSVRNWFDASARLARRYPQAAALVFFAATTVLQTWPLAAHVADASRNDNGDAILTEWIISWVAHQAPRNPARLFDANIFYPNTRTLAYSESMLLQSAFAAPFLWLGASPVLAYNMVLLIGFTLSGWTMSLVVQRWTGSWVAALASGLLFAYNSHVFVRMAQLQALHPEFLPLVVLSLDIVLRDPGWRHALRLAVCLALQSLASVYLMAFSALAVIVGTIVRPEAWWGRKFANAAFSLIAAAGAASLLLLPYLLPYWAVRQQQGDVTSATAVTRSAATWVHYLGTPSRIDFALFSHRYFVGVGLFPGILGLALTAVALTSGVAFRDRRARMCLAIGAVGLALSFGRATPGFTFLRRTLIFLQAVRDVPRFGYLVIFAVAVLAGFGVRVLSGRIAPAWRPAAAVMMLALIAVEQAVAPIGFTRFKGIPAIYAQLRDVDRAVAIELPIYSRIAAAHNAPYMLNSTANWKPLLNGYSGFEPLGYREAAETYQRFPEPVAIAALQAVGVTHVFVHLDWYGDLMIGVLEKIPVLHQIGRKDRIALYRLDPP